eukprot:scaffold12017_cov120-Isochrysis_galbana.AAC.2
MAWFSKRKERGRDVEGDSRSRVDGLLEGMKVEGGQSRAAVTTRERRWRSGLRFWCSVPSLSCLTGCLASRPDPVSRLRPSGGRFGASGATHVAVRRGRRRALHGVAPAQRQRAADDRDGHKHAIRRPRLRAWRVLAAGGGSRSGTHNAPGTVLAPVPALAPCRDGSNLCRHI